MHRCSVYSALLKLKMKKLKKTKKKKGKWFDTASLY